MLSYRSIFFAKLLSYRSIFFAKLLSYRIIFAKLLSYPIIIAGFDYGQQHVVEILEDDISSYLLPPKTEASDDQTGSSIPGPAGDVSEYSFYNSLTRTVVVLSGSCVHVLARANMFPKATLTC